MRKNILILLFAFALTSNAQTADSVKTNGSQVDIYYDFESQSTTAADISQWDVAFTAQSMDASILINESKGVKLFTYSADTNAWNSVDTAGFDFSSNEVYNSSSSWSVGAFNSLASGHPDYGWGTYNSSSHDINGSRIFLVQQPNGLINQIVIVKLSASGMYKIKVGDLGGANTIYDEFVRTDYSDKFFAYYDVQNKSISDIEPAKEDWQLLFTKYIASVVIQGGQTLQYPVTGVKIKKGLRVAERSGVDVTSNDTSTLIWTENMTEIGYDWKTFNNQTFQYEIQQDLSYFVRNDNGDMWKIWFTNYKGSTDGIYYFNTQKIATAGIEDVEKIVSFKIYPNPTSSIVRLANDQNIKLLYNVVSTAGQVLIQGEVRENMTQEINVSDLPKGVYFMNVTSGRSSSTQRLLVE